MMRRLSATIAHESWEQAREAKRHNRALRAAFTINRRKVEVPIASGEGDDISVWQEGKGKDARAIVLSVSRGLPYCGVEIFDAKGGPAGEVFFQEGAVYDALGSKGVDLADVTIAKRLAEFVC
jgi:hypothetical protein